MKIPRSAYNCVYIACQNDVFLSVNDLNGTLKHLDSCFASSNLYTYIKDLKFMLNANRNDGYDYSGFLKALRAFVYENKKRYEVKEDILYIFDCMVIASQLGDLTDKIIKKQGLEELPSISRIAQIILYSFLLLIHLSKEYGQLEFSF